MTKVLRPHNRHGMDLRWNPHCYLCGGGWRPVTVLHGMLVVRCGRCNLKSFAKRDEAVEKARGWA